MSHVFDHYGPVKPGDLGNRLMVFSFDDRWCDHGVLTCITFRTAVAL